MSVSFGGLGLMSLRYPLTKLAGLVYGKGDIKSIFCMAVCFVVFVILAYLTNPSENSFRTYLTEQSFRQHLSRLDDTADDDQGNADDYAVARRKTLNSRAYDAFSPFHFANRASVSLRTPRHCFRSCGIFTIAAIVPDSTASDRTANNRDGSMVSDSWYIGAFGKWWRGGILEAWYQDVIAGSKDEERWSSGILGVRASDKLNDFNGLPFTTKSPSSRKLSRGSPPKLRNRDRSSNRSGLPTRSSTPPPLPKSASLPLHTTRFPSATGNTHATTHLSPPHSRTYSVRPVATTSEQVRLGSPVVARSPSAIFEDSPVIAEVLRQISLSKSTVLDLRNQLTDFQSTAAQSHAILQSEVDTFRDRKRQEDTSRLELKSKIKTLEDSKRCVESTKRDAEKKLKATQHARNDATHRMKYLDEEIARLEQRLLDDEVTVRQSKVDVNKAEQTITEALEYKRQEIKVTEDVVAALNVRARELEDKVAAERERLKLVREHADIAKQDRSFHPHHVGNPRAASGSWPANPHGVPVQSMERNEHPEGIPPIDSNFHIRGPLKSSRDLSVSPKPAHLALAGISNLNNGLSLDGKPKNGGIRSKGYSIFDDDLASLSQLQSALSPFSGQDEPLGGTTPMSMGVSPMSSSLIPSSLITSLNNTDGLPRSFQSDADPFMARDWRRGHVQHLQSIDTQSSGPGPLTTSPTSLHGLHDDAEHDPFEVRMLPPHNGGRREASRANPMDMQRVSLLHRAQSDPIPLFYAPADEPIVQAEPVTNSGPRRWFSTSSKEKPKKGLNPDAKVFSLSSRKPPPTVIVAPSSPTSPTSPYDALNPHGLGSGIMSSIASTNSSLLRAFAPSPAEREALQRALGGSTNTSLERLPSLSDVGSIPPSPSHVHAVAAPPQHSSVDLGKVLPSWLQSLPRIRKTNFSPWDDDDPAVAAGEGDH